MRNIWAQTETSDFSWANLSFETLLRSYLKSGKLSGKLPAALTSVQTACNSKLKETESFLGQQEMELLYQSSSYPLIQMIVDLIESERALLSHSDKLKDKTSDMHE